MITMYPQAGSYLGDVCRDAANEAEQANDEVEFTFDRTGIIVRPGEKAEDVEKRWHRNHETAVTQTIERCE